MRARNRVVAGSLTVALLLSFPSAAFARGDGDVAVKETVTDQVTDRPTDHRVDRVTDRPTDRPSGEITDRPNDRPSDRITDRPRDREIDRCSDRVTDRVGRDCIEERHPHDHNIRQLIHRLVHAGEWAKLVRLLTRLGWI